MRSAVALVVALSACAPALVASPPPPPHVSVFEARDHAITEGETVLAVDPATAYAALTDYARWSSIFPGVHGVVVTARDGVDARVTLLGDDGHRDNLHFRNRPAARQVWFEDTGGRAEVWAEISLLPASDPAMTRVHTRLYADVHGLASLVVSDDRLRSMRQRKLASDLTDLRNYFNRAAAR